MSTSKIEPAHPDAPHASLDSAFRDINGSGRPISGCRSLIVIPARLASTRLPHKLLLRDTGKTVLQHTFEAASEARRPTGVIVAVDSTPLLEEVQRFGGSVIMTDPKLSSGTDRVVEVARLKNDIDIFVNVQGDEPDICPSAIDQVIELLTYNPDANVATLATPIRDKQRLMDPACVKVVRDHADRALFFSRSAIPHARSWNDVLLESSEPCFLQHLGIYAYRREFLLRLGELPPSPLEQIEKLEQLRFLQSGCTVHVGTVEHAESGIDTAEDYQAFVQRHRRIAA